VSIAAKPAATTAAFAVFLATFLSFERLLGIDHCSEVLAFVDARLLSLVLRFAVGFLDLARVPFADSFAVVRFAGLFMISSGALLPQVAHFPAARQAMLAAWMRIPLPFRSLGLYPAL
jgi:hypothetical protein